MCCDYGKNKIKNQGARGKMSGKNDRKIRKEVRGVYIKAQEVLYEEIKKLSFGKRVRFALMVIFKRLK